MKKKGTKFVKSEGFADPVAFNKIPEHIEPEKPWPRPEDKTKTGGSAFPGYEEIVTKTVIIKGKSVDVTREKPVPGMTLRDHFAGQADIPHNSVMEYLELNYQNKKPTIKEFYETKAKLQYFEADAMIEARKS